MSPVLFFLSLYTVCTQAATVIFEQSDDVDQYCAFKYPPSDGSATTQQCLDIQTILDGCGNITFLRPFLNESVWNELDHNHECKFQMYNGHSIHKSYLLSSQTNGTTITFEYDSFNDTQLTIHLRQPFLIVSSYSGHINLNNIHFTSHTNNTYTHFVDIIHENTEFELRIHQCSFHHLSNLLYIPYVQSNIDYSQPIRIIFRECDLNRNIVLNDTALLFIERNNVHLILDDTVIQNNTVSPGSVVHWRCQPNTDGTELCGDLYIANASEFTHVDGSLFTMDIRADPEDTYFNLTVLSSHFQYITGPIFNFNVWNQILTHYDGSIQSENTLVNIQKSSFYDNGDVDTINGAIFSINAATVPMIDIANSSFINNSASNGAIFNWYCSRVYRTGNDRNCGDITLNHTILEGNTIRVPKNQREAEALDATFYTGSLLHFKMRDDFTFFLYIHACPISQHIGNMIYIESLDFNSSADSNESNATFTGSCRMSLYDIDLMTGIYIDASQFIHNVYCPNQCEKKGNTFYPSDREAAWSATIISTVGIECIPIVIENSLFERNEGGKKDRAIIIDADYAPYIYLDHTTFIQNGRIGSDSIWPLFSIGSVNNLRVSESDITIIGCNFTGDQVGVSTSDVDIGILQVIGASSATGSIAYTKLVDVVLDITDSFFIGFSAFNAALFLLSDASVSIHNSVLDGNRFAGSAIRLDIGEVTIQNSIIQNNTNTGFLLESGLIWIGDGTMDVFNLTAFGNTMTQNALLFIRNGAITMHLGEYRDNTLYKEDVASIASAPIINVTEVRFINNIGTCFAYVNDNLHLRVTSSHFIAQTNRVNGGSVVFSNGSNASIHMDRSHFVNNTVDFDADTCEAIESGLFLTNAKGGSCDTPNGGAVYIYHGYLTMDQCTMTGNKALVGGFAFVGNSSTILITNSINEGNEATMYDLYGFGGFIALGHGTSLHMNNVNSSYNYAMSGGAILGSQNNNISLHQCHFRSNAAEFNGYGIGGAIYVQQGHLTCDGCHSDANVADNGGFIWMGESYVELRHTSSFHDVAHYYGGMIYVTSDSVNVGQFKAMDCNITSPSASRGAFLYSNLNNSILVNAIKVSDARSNASVLFAEIGTIAVLQSQFIHNTATQSAGVLYLGNRSHVTIHGSTFYNNSATDMAGCIYAIDNTDLKIYNSQFEFNSANTGGAIAVYTGAETPDVLHTSYVYIEGTIFHNNTASASGGAIWIERTGYDEEAEMYAHEIVLIDNIWTNNAAVQGGAIWINFQFDLLAASGMGCYREISQHQTVQMTHNIFKRNYATRMHNNNTNSSNDTTQMYDNMNGGAFVLLCLNVNIFRTAFDSCHAESNGGVGYVSDSNVWMDQCNFTSHDAVQSDGQLFHVSNLEHNDHDAFIMNRSAIYGFQAQTPGNYSLFVVTEISLMVFDNVRFYENEISLFNQQRFLCPLVRFYQCYFTSNTGYYIIDIMHSTLEREGNDAVIATTELDEVRFENNSVHICMVRLLMSHTTITRSDIISNTNKAVYSTFIHVGHVSVIHTTFVSNIGLYEGILSIDQNAVASIEHTQFINNHVDVKGGAIRSYARVLRINHCSFWNNSAHLGGGHMVHYEGTLSVTNTSFRYGYTAGNGGAIMRYRNHAIYPMETHISNTIFESNVAGLHGGAVFHDTVSRHKDTHLRLNDVRFARNTAQISGAATYIKNKFEITLHDANVTYTNNTAHQITGDVMSWPIQLHVQSDVNTICPNCNVSVTVYTTDVYNNSWPPHDFHEYIMSHSRMDNITSLKDIAVLFNSSIEIKQSMSSQNKSQLFEPQILNVRTQSMYYKKGNGTLTFGYGPALFGDELTLTVIGIASDGSSVFDNKSISFTIDNCPEYYGAWTEPNQLGFACYVCEKGFYKFMRTHEDKCLPCETGARCDGYDTIFVETDHYPIIKTLPKTSSSGFFHLSELKVIECRPGSCCVNDECLIWNTDDLCPTNRNGSSALCAECNDGYTVSPYSNECMICDDWAMIGTFGYFYFLIPFLLYGGLIWWWGHKNAFEAGLDFWEVYMFKTLMFFYQITPSINILIPSPEASESTGISATIEGFFNFANQLPNVCAFENMTNLQRMLLSLVMPCVCVWWMVIFWFLEKVGCCSKAQAACCWSSCKQFINFYFTTASVKFGLSVYATFTRFFFDLLTCRSLDEDTERLYFAADTECSEPWSIVTHMGAIICSLCPILLFCALYANRSGRQRTTIWHLLTLGYKRRAWWYEAYRILCRLIVIVITVLNVPELYRLALIRYTVFCFLIIHVWFIPYAKKYRADVGFDINHTEIFCLFILCILAMMADYEHEAVLTAYNVLKTLPVALIPLLIVWNKVLHRLPEKYIPDREEIMPQKTEDWFISPRTPFNATQRMPAITPTAGSSSDDMYRDEDDDYDEKQIVALPSRLEEDDSMWEAKDQEPMNLLPVPTRIRTINRDRSDMSDFGVSVDIVSDYDDVALHERQRQRTISKRGSMYTSLSQNDSDEENKLKSTRL